MSDIEDTLPDLIAGVSQMSMFLKDFMPVVAAMRDAALDNGFSREESASMAQSWMLQQFEQGQSARA